MQQLQIASDSGICARQVLETVLEVLVTVRENTARRHRGGRPSMIHLRAMGVLSKRPGATLSMLSDQLALTLSATSRLVDTLVHKGLLVRTIPPGNRRTLSLELTPRGAKILDTCMRQTQMELAQPLSRLSPRQRAALCRTLSSLRYVMHSPSPSANGALAHRGPRRQLPSAKRSAAE